MRAIAMGRTSHHINTPAHVCRRACRRAHRRAYRSSYIGEKVGYTFKLRGPLGRGYYMPELPKEQRQEREQRLQEKYPEATIEQVRQALIAEDYHVGKARGMRINGADAVSALLVYPSVCARLAATVQVLYCRCAALLSLHSLCTRL